MSTAATKRPPVIQPYSSHNINTERLRAFWRPIRQAMALFAKERIGVFGLFIIVLFGVGAIAHPILMATVWDYVTYHPVTGFDYNILAHPAPPSTAHLLGTDPLGRDILSMLLYSAASEFALGIMAAFVTLVVATSVGALSAYLGGPIDVALMRLADLVIMMPALTLLIVLATLWDLNFWSLALLVGLLSGFGAAAVVIKSQALTVKVKPFIDAARVGGCGPLRIVFTHIFPNVLPLSFLFMMYTVTAAVFAEATLSYLGFLNVRMSWGIMLHTTSSQGYLTDFTKWWLVLPAGMAITLLCGSFYLVGRGLDPIINPRLRTP